MSIGQKVDSAWRRRTARPDKEERNAGISDDLRGELGKAQMRVVSATHAPLPVRSYECVGVNPTTSFAVRQ